MPYRASLSLLFALLAACPVLAQTSVSGTVRDRATGRAVESVNVMLQDTSRRAMYGYVITDKEGAYRLEYAGRADTLLLVVTGFNISPQSRRIAARTQRVDLYVEHAELKIREVTVKAPPVTRQGDTLTYIVAKFADVVDSSIGDVLKKMPGIEVGKSGEIKYNGKAINKFYVEGMDMLEGRYGIATKNIRARDIASVQVFQNHQPIRALKDIAPSDRAAINLRLKDEARGTWSGTMQLGAGYKPAMWNAEAVAMYFGRSFQTIDTYKTNNTGDDVARELNSHYGGLESASSIVGVQRPSTPALDESRYLDNDIHTVSVNTITKLKKELELTANAQYLHDLRHAEGSSVTTYFLPDAAPVVVSELTQAGHRIDRTEVNLQLRSNTDRKYLQEKLSFGGEWDNDFGRVLSDGSPVDQRFRLPKISVRNYFSAVLRRGRRAFNLTSDTDYGTQPARLRIRPMLYPELFDGAEGYPDAQQTLDNRRFRTRNSCFTSYTVGRWTFLLRGALNAQIEWMDSELSPMNASGDVLPATDGMRNGIYWRRLDIYAGPSVGYRAGDRFSVNLYCPLDFVSLRSEDRIRDRRAKSDDVLLAPSLSLQGSLSYNLKFTARASYNELVGGLYDTYNGYIMTSYRMISGKEGDISRNRTQSYSASLSYGNAIRALFGSLDVSYNRSKRNLMYGTTYEGSLCLTESIRMDNRSSGYSLAAKISKRFDGIATTLGLSGGFSRSWSDVLRQGVLLPQHSDLATAAFTLSTRFSQAVRLDYTLDYTRSQSTVDGEALRAIDVVREDAALNFIVRRKFICRIGGEHYYNGAVGGRDRNMFFLDASLTYKGRRTEYAVEARNLLDTGSFGSASQTDITHYVYSSKLRPASVLFKIKISLK